MNSPATAEDALLDEAQATGALSAACIVWARAAAAG